MFFMDTITSTYSIPALRLASVQSKIDILNRRCRRLKIAEITITVTGTETVEHGTKEKPNKVLHNIVEVTGTRPKLGGWEFAATFEHDAETGLTILRKSDAFKGEIPVQYRKASPVCDHCKKDRRRNDTFLCYHAEGWGFKQVGRNCLKDFLGHGDPHSIVGAAEVWFDLSEVFSEGWEEGGEGGGARGPVVLPFLEFVQRAFAVVRVRGFLGRVKARELNDGGGNALATADRIVSLLLPTREDRERAAWQEEDAATQPNEQDLERAAASIEWVRGFDVQSEKLSDYEHNLFVSCASDLLPARRVGLAASLPAAYLKHIDRAEQLQKDREGRKPSNFVGNVGERIEITAKLTKVIAIESEQWGTSYLHKFEAKSGDRFSWFCSSSPWDEQEEPYTFLGTVKKHQDDPKWGKETQLSRCKVGKAKVKGKKRAGGAPDATAPLFTSVRDDSLTPRIDPREYYEPAF